MRTKKIYLIGFVCYLTLLTVIPPCVSAQDQLVAGKFQQEELDQMLAPIALYPDSLLAQVLMAATYPLEVVQADRWTKENRNLGSDGLNDALDQKNWDLSIKALVSFPQVLSIMSENLEWTQALGDAFLDQQDEVMDTVQELRHKAQASGNLKDTPEQEVFAEDDDIEIEPSNPEVVYVPVYDPDVVYGPWWYPAFPPVYFLPPSWMVIAFHGGIGFGRGIAVGTLWSHGWGYWDWRNHSLNVNINRNININRNKTNNRTNIQTTRWQHLVSRRKSVSYSNEVTREHYGPSVRGAENRRNFRGFQSRTQQAPAAPMLGVSQTRSRQAPAVVQQGLNRDKRRSALRSSPDHGSTVQKQSDRGRQSPQNTPQKGAGTWKGNRTGRQL